MKFNGNLQVKILSYNKEYFNPNLNIKIKL